MRADLRPKIATLLALYAQRRAAITERIEEFSRVPPQDYFYELAYCLLTPQSRADHAERVIETLRAQDFHILPFDPVPILAERTQYVRFHRTKGKRLLRLCETYGTIQETLASSMSPSEIRSWLVKSVDGFGLKEATHFLRNIGRNGELAILDRHILRNLQRFGVLRSVPPSLGKQTYLRIEKRFLAFSRNLGIPLNHLDLLFWSNETGAIRK